MGSILLDFIKLARPHQYVKNGFILLPLLFGYQLTNLASVGNAFLAFISFSLAASAQYVLNDIQDVEEDKNHPAKCRRPIASGRIKNSEAYLFLAVLGASSLLIGLFLLNMQYIWCLIAYFLLNTAYSYYLKHIAIVDIVCVAVSYVLRAFAGAVVITVFPSHWLILMTFLLALFLSLAKRRDDLLLAQYGKNTRKCIEHYNFEFISGAMMVMASVTIVSYLLYTVSPEVIAKHGTDNLYLTVFWVILGFLRYMQVTFVEGKSGSPTQVILRDTFLQTIIFLWILTFVVLLYVAGD